LLLAFRHFTPDPWKFIIPCFLFMIHCFTFAKILKEQAAPTELEDRRHT